MNGFKLSLNWLPRPPHFVAPHRQFTREQREQLETSFAHEMYITAYERFVLATAVDLTEKQVNCWFKNRRKKQRELMLVLALV